MGRDNDVPLPERDAFSETIWGTDNQVRAPIHELSDKLLGIWNGPLSWFRGECRTQTGAGRA